MDLAEALVNFLVPYLPYLLKGGKEAIKAVIQGMGEEFGSETWNFAKQIWGKLRPKIQNNKKASQVIGKITESPDDKNIQYVFISELRTILKQNEQLKNEVEILVKQGQKRGINLFTAKDSVVITGESNAPIITGSNNIVNLYQSVTEQNLPDTYSKHFSNILFGINQIQKDLMESTPLPKKGEFDEEIGQRVLAEGIRNYVERLKQSIEKT